MKLRVCYSEHKVSPGEVFNLTSPPQPRSYHVCTTCSSKGHGHMLGLKLKPPSLGGFIFRLLAGWSTRQKDHPLPPKMPLVLAGSIITGSLLLLHTMQRELWLSLAGHRSKTCLTCIISVNSAYCYCGTLLQWAPLFPLSCADSEWVSRMHPGYCDKKKDPDQLTHDPTAKVTSIIVHPNQWANNAGWSRWRSLLACSKTESMQDTLENDVYSKHEQKKPISGRTARRRRVIRSLCVFISFVCWEGRGVQEELWCSLLSLTVRWPLQRNHLGFQREGESRKELRNDAGMPLQPSKQP